jgi:predicted component of type VI protein secretion system
LFAEANLVMPVINLDKEDKNDKSSTWKPFDEASATSSVRRNLQAFVTTTNNSTKNGLKTYAEKAKY